MFRIFENGYQCTQMWDLLQIRKRVKTGFNPFVVIPSAGITQSLNLFLNMSFYRGVSWGSLNQPLSLSLAKTREQIWASKRTEIENVTP